MVKQASEASGIGELNEALSLQLKHIAKAERELPIYAIEGRAAGTKVTRGLMAVLDPTPGVVGSKMGDVAYLFIDSSGGEAVQRRKIPPQ